MHKKEPVVTDGKPDGFYLLRSSMVSESSLVKLYNHKNFNGVRHIAFGAWDGGGIIPVWDLRDDSTLTPVSITTN